MIRRVAAFLLFVCGLLLAWHIILIARLAPPRREILVSLVVLTALLALWSASVRQAAIRPLLRNVLVAVGGLFVGAIWYLRYDVLTRVIPTIPNADIALKAQAQEWQELLAALLPLTIYGVLCLLFLPTAGRAQAAVTPTDRQSPEPSQQPEVTSGTGSGDTAEQGGDNAD